MLHLSRNKEGMKTIIGIFLLAIGSVYGQESTIDVPAKNIVKKGSFYAYWGWNRSLYSSSDIHFKGNNYDFTLTQITAKDRQSKFAFSTYFQTITIPQYNLRIGYFLNDKYDISFGADHMKYVMVGNQFSTITGNINTGSDFDGVYEGNKIAINPSFLQFEHTDGLNYLNAEIRRNDKIISYKKLKINVIEGIGAGVVVPRSNVTLLNYVRYDQFHLAGFGLGAVLGLNFQFWDRYFIQFEEKVGYINLPDIRTTMHEEDRASQDFTWLQANFSVGVNFNYKKKIK
jgi:hypothetical protein